MYIYLLICVQYLISAENNQPYIVPAKLKDQGVFKVFKGIYCDF